MASSERRTGQVKWFNNKQGYGFLVVHSLGNEPNMDTFVHHSSLRTSGDQFRYLVQGEYVEFSLGKATDGRTVATEVTGIKGGQLMCEVRAERGRAAAEHAADATVLQAIQST